VEPLSDTTWAPGVHPKGVLRRPWIHFARLNKNGESLAFSCEEDDVGDEAPRHLKKGDGLKKVILEAKKTYKKSSMGAPAKKTRRHRKSRKSFF